MVLRRMLVVIVVGVVAPLVSAAEEFITVASTTSTENSGLFDALLPAFTASLGIDVHVVAVGTGKAIKLAERGDADVLFVHHRASEERFVTEGFGVARYDVMYNDFVLIGPQADPARVKGLTDIAAALQKVHASETRFLSRGDDSGTHKKELALWHVANVEPARLPNAWYQETGQGMGATLNIASQLGGYCLSDRATWLNFRNKGTLKLLVQGDARLHNQYGVVLVSSAKHPHVKRPSGQSFIDWLISDAGQSAIDAYRINGEQAFFANAKKN